MARTLSIAGARRFYDRVGRLEDSQAFYTDPAFAIILRDGRFESARSVMEFGCGTGRLAARLLAGPLGEGARYAGCDISPRMLAITRARLAGFAPRVTLWQSDAACDLGPGGPPYDRIVTTYVLDLLSPQATSRFLRAAQAALAPGGLLCAASITDGRHGIPAWVSGAWRAVHRLSPVLTGGCRPVRLSGMLHAKRWVIRHHHYMTAWGIASEVVIATPGKARAR